jgi:transcriptional regulator GlxA family with amidase domain
VIFDAASAAYYVGYHKAAHFNREYKSLFSLPLMHDMERLRGTVRESINLAAD